MESDFYTEEGINFSYEDVIALVVYTIPEVIKRGYKDDEILDYYDSVTWRREVLRYLKSNYS
jgi:hypothetical protein